MAVLYCETNAYIFTKRKFKSHFYPFPCCDFIEMISKAPNHREREKKEIKYGIWGFVVTVFYFTILKYIPGKSQLLPIFHL